MSESTKRNGSGWLGIIGVGIGLAVALLVDRFLLDTASDRPLIIAGVTAFVALIWLMIIRFVFGPTPVRAKAAPPKSP